MAEPVISVMAAIIWAVDLWMLFMNHILMEKKNFVKLMKNTERIWEL